MKNINRLLKSFADGSIVIVFDDENRENEADLIVSIEKITPEKVNFLITHGKGLLCASLSESIINNIGIPLMPTNKSDPHSTAFTISVDSKKTTTGISPEERYITAKELIEPDKSMKDFITPGHLFPLIAKNGGLLERRGHTEAAASLCKWTDQIEAALICEMINDEGKMYTQEEARKFAKKHNIPFCTVDELVNYQNIHYTNVEKTAQAKLKTDWGIFDITVYHELYKNKEHVFLSMGDYKNGPVRIHSECFTGDVLFSRTCDCKSQLHAALKKISEEGKGAVVYLKQEGRGIGLAEKIKAYALQQNKGLDTAEANLELGHKVDNRDYHQAAWILKDQGFKKVRLLTNNPNKAEGLEKHNLEVKIEDFDVCVMPENFNYLYTKKTKMGHKIKLQGVK